MTFFLTNITTKEWSTLYNFLNCIYFISYFHLLYWHKMWFHINFYVLAFIHTVHTFIHIFYIAFMSAPFWTFYLYLNMFNSLDDWCYGKDIRATGRMCLKSLWKAIVRYTKEYITFSLINEVTAASSMLKLIEQNVLVTLRL